LAALARELVSRHGCHLGRRWKDRETAASDFLFNIMPTCIDTGKSIPLGPA